VENCGEVELYGIVKEVYEYCIQYYLSHLVT
ncbi:MAG: hypothetical protein K0R78_3372, partial [Pelosinus sp.]|nr:hypothetical protein [Pelosinus sp.]